MDANMDARICIFACMPASMWLCKFKGICGTIHVFINIYICTCMFLLFACMCMHSPVYLPPKPILAEKQDWTILFTNGILMRREFLKFTNLLNINQHQINQHHLRTLITPISAKMLSNCLTKVPNLQRLGETRTFFRVLGADEVLQRAERTWRDSPVVGRFAPVKVPNDD